MAGFLSWQRAFAVQIWAMQEQEGLPPHICPVCHQSSNDGNLVLHCFATHDIAYPSSSTTDSRGGQSSASTPASSPPHSGFDGKCPYCTRSFHQQEALEMHLWSKQGQDEAHPIWSAEQIQAYWQRVAPAPAATKPLAEQRPRSPPKSKPGEARSSAPPSIPPAIVKHIEAPAKKFGQVPPPASLASSAIKSPATPGRIPPQENRPHVPKAVIAKPAEQPKAARAPASASRGGGRHTCCGSNSSPSQAPRSRRRRDPPHAPRGIRRGCRHPRGGHFVHSGGNQPPQETARAPQRARATSSRSSAHRAGDQKHLRSKV